MYIRNNSSYSLVSGTAENDDIYNYGSHVTLVGGAGDDAFNSFSSLVADSYEGYVTIFGEAGNDSVKAFGDTVLVDGGDGNDYIYSSGNDNTIIGGNGDDSIDLLGLFKSVLIQYSEGDGYDTISGVDSYTTIKVDGSDYSTYDSGDDLIVRVGSGNIVLKNKSGQSVNIEGTGDSTSNETSSGAQTGQYISHSGIDANYSLVSGTAYNDTVYTYGDYVTVDGYGGDDYIVSFDRSRDDGYAGHVTIYGGDGKDTVHGWGYPGLIDGGNDADYLYAGNDNLTVDGGNGNDEIITYGNHTSISAGAGNDSINLTSLADDSTIAGGTGDDTITIEWAERVLLQYSSGDGNDIVEGFDSDDTIKITGDAYSKSDDGDDLLLTVGDGSIRFKDMAGENINIVGTLADGSTVQETVEPVTYVINDGTSEQAAQGENASNIYYITQYIFVNNNNETNINVSSTTNNFTNISVSETTNNINIINLTENNTYVYRGGAQIIQNYQQGEVVRLESDYQGIDVSGNTFIVKSSTGNLEIQNSRNKFIGYSGGFNNVVAYSYLASGGGQIDGRGRSQTEIMIGGDHVNNEILAGNGGSSLWGGNGGADTLVGGDGYDEFFFALGSGGDVIQNANSGDMINLLGVSLDQISEVYVSTEQVHINFTSGEFLQVKGDTGVAYRVANQTYVCNQSTGQWSVR